MSLVVESRGASVETGILTASKLRKNFRYAKCNHQKFGVMKE